MSSRHNPIEGYPPSSSGTSSSHRPSGLPRAKQSSRNQTLVTPLDDTKSPSPPSTTRHPFQSGSIRSKKGPRMEKEVVDIDDFIPKSSLNSYARETKSSQNRRVSSNPSTTGPYRHRGTLQEETIPHHLGPVVKLTSKNHGRVPDKSDDYGMGIGLGSLGKGMASDLSRQLKARQARVYDENALNDIDAFNEADFDEDQTTITATDTIKAKLAAPPPRQFGSIRSLKDDPVVISVLDGYEDEKMEDDLVFPDRFRLDRSKLVGRDRSTASFSDPSKISRPNVRDVFAEHGSPSVQLDNPTTPSLISRRGGSAMQDSHDSSKRLSETSTTSYTSLDTPKDAASIGQRLGSDSDDSYAEFFIPPRAKLQLRNSRPWEERVQKRSHHRQATDESVTSEASFEQSRISGLRSVRSRLVIAKKASIGTSLRIKDRTRDLHGQKPKPLDPSIASIGRAQGRVSSSTGPLPSHPATDHPSDRLKSTNDAIRRQQSSNDLQRTKPVLSPRKSTNDLLNDSQRSTTSFTGETRLDRRTHISPASTRLHSLVGRKQSRPSLPIFFDPSEHVERDRDSTNDTRSVSSVSSGASARPGNEPYRYSSRGGSNGKLSGKKSSNVHQTIPETWTKEAHRHVDPDLSGHVSKVSPPKEHKESGSRLLKSTKSSEAKSRKPPNDHRHKSNSNHAGRTSKDDPPVRELIKPQTMSERFGMAISEIKTVGRMQFDPQKMCWVSLDEEATPDWGDEMDDDFQEQGPGSTIRGNMVQVGPASFGRSTSTTNTNFSSVSKQSYASSRLTSISSISERGSVRVYDQTNHELFSDALARECEEAEKRHRKEARGWFDKKGKGSVSDERRRKRELIKSDHRMIADYVMSTSRIPRDEFGDV